MYCHSKTNRLKNNFFLTHCRSTNRGSRGFFLMIWAKSWPYLIYWSTNHVCTIFWSIGKLISKGTRTLLYIRLHNKYIFWDWKWKIWKLQDWIPKCIQIFNLLIYSSLFRQYFSVMKTCSADSLCFMFPHEQIIKSY